MPSVYSGIPDGDEKWLSDLAREMFFEKENPDDFVAENPDQNPANNLARYIFHLYSQRDKSGKSSLARFSDLAGLVRFLERIERGLLLMEVASEFDEMPEPFDPTRVSLEAKCAIHTEAARRKPYLFTGGLDPTKSRPGPMSKMWKDARMKFRDNRPWGST